MFIIEKCYGIFYWCREVHRNQFVIKQVALLPSKVGKYKHIPIAIQVQQCAVSSTFKIQVTQLVVSKPREFTYTAGDYDCVCHCACYCCLSGTHLPLISSSPNLAGKQLIRTLLQLNGPRSSLYNEIFKGHPNKLHD